MPQILGAPARPAATSFADENGQITLESCVDPNGLSPPKPSLDSRIAQISFSDILGHQADADMNYSFIFYNSASGNENKGAISSQKEIGEFLEKAEFDIVEFRKLDGDNPGKQRAAVMWKRGKFSYYYADLMEVLDTPAARNYQGCLVEWSRDAIMDVWNDMHISIESERERLEEIRRLLKIA
ncbi:hypothetical protein HYX02_06095 [Candidatus Woesearchaeota archaeon]|nr:hypothetical protein [Candidatus Woesearchaeota archaeon]